MASLSASSLVEKCTQYEQDAWDEFLHRYGPLIHGTVARKLASLGLADAKADAEDIFQEVFKDLVENDCRALASIKNRERIESWLCAVALHKTIDFVRKKGRNSRSAAAHSLVAEQSASHSPSAASDADMLKQVSDAVKQLRPDEKLLLKWYYEDSLKYREIARIANIPINTVSSRLFRIKRKLFRHLSKAGIV